MFSHLILTQIRGGWKLTYAHNEEADFAASQLASMFAHSPKLCYAESEPADIPRISACASYEPGNSRWPLADGVISLVRSGASSDQQDIALEYKRESEGVHGLLTAIGQSLSYLHKGYSGSVIVIPREYRTHTSPADHIVSVLDTNQVGSRVGVFDYEFPDKKSARPFKDKLRCVRPLSIGEAETSTSTTSRRSRTQWAHVREGSMTRDVAYRYLQAAMQLATGTSSSEDFEIPPKLTAAVKRIDSSADVAQYLSHTSDDRFLSRVWRCFWFNWVATKDVLTPYIKSGGSYAVPGALTTVQKDDGSGYSEIFEGRANGLKETLVLQLNANSITENQAWESMAKGFDVPGRQNKQGVHARAHSYREDVDSAIAQLMWIDNEGRPTDSGYRFVNLCERFGGANSNAAIDYFGATLIQAGRFGSFLHYVHRLSEEIFDGDPLAFTRVVDGQPTFTEDSYWEYLGEIQRQLVDDLKVMTTAPGRGRARVRTTFQAELTFLRRYGFLPADRASRYRLGVGLPINWVKVHEAMDVEL